jgi:trimeric autotransporter adhesin
VRPVRPGAAVPKARSGWGRSGHRRAVLVGGLVTVILVAGAVAAWATISAGSTGYRTASVTRADIGTSLTVVGNVEPVNDVAPSFQVGGQVATVTVAPGQAVTAGQTLATLDTTALGETVSSDQSALNADQAKLVEDEENESAASSASSAAAGSGAATSKTTTPSSTTTTTTVPSSSATASNATVVQDQTTLTQDEATLNTDQQKEAADLTQAQTECTSANTATPTGQATCEAGLQTVSTDEQQVSKDQTSVSKDETALGQALTAASGGGSSSGGTGRSGGAPSSSPTQTSAALSSPTSDGVTLTASITGNTGSGATTGGDATGGSGSTDTDTPEQIASDQADIDTAQAQLTEAQQSLNETTLTSPITGTVVSVGIDVGDTVSAGSSTEIITIIGTNSYEAQATLDSAQVPTVKVGQTTSVEVDGDNGSLAGTVAQVGPVQSSTSGYSYPVVVALPATAGNLHAGSAANLTIATGKVSNVVAVPTSAVQTTGSVSYVTELDKGTLTRKVIKIGMVGSEYTQVLSGLTPGQSVVLADYAEAVPSSNTETNTFGGLGGLGGGGGGFGGGGFGGGGGAFRARAVDGGGFGG